MSSCFIPFTAGVQRLREQEAVVRVLTLILTVAGASFLAQSHSSARIGAARLIAGRTDFLGGGRFRVPRVAAHAAVAAVHDAVADHDALHRHVLARTALGAFVVDTKSVVGQKISHALDQLLGPAGTGG